MAGDDPQARDVFLRRVAELERVLDGQLQDWRTAGRLDFAFMETVTVWSKAVWSTAKALGPATLSPAASASGPRLARHPVFICGVHRSGTTLLRDLLDGHPELVVLPSESEFYTRLEPVMGRMTSAARAAYLCQCWLQRLANPINQPPYWLLGRSDASGSPYVDFARRFLAWWALLESGSADAGSRPLGAYALAYAGRSGGPEIPVGARMWAEKTPTNERFLGRIWSEFPQARVLHVVRRPDEVLSSYKTLLRRAGMNVLGQVWTLRNLARSYDIALARLRDAPPDRYRLVRYEHLVADPADAMGQVARFLGIDPAPVLSRPLVAGLPATNNSSFAAGRRGPADGLTALELDLLALTTGSRAARLGYPGIEPASVAGKIVARLLSSRRRAPCPTPGLPRLTSGT